MNAPVLAATIVAMPAAAPVAPPARVMVALYRAEEDPATARAIPLDHLLGILRVPTSTQWSLLLGGAVDIGGGMMARIVGAPRPAAVGP